MGYLDNTTVTVEAILTKRGREILSQGGQLGITKFAVSDDEIDYRLWNEAHPLGSAYYGAAIENMPILEACPDETQVMRYKLITMDKKNTRIPQLNIGTTIIVLQGKNSSYSLTPQTLYLDDARYGYTAILHNYDYAYLTVPADGVIAQQGTTPLFLSDVDKSQSQTAVGKKFIINARDISPYLPNSGLNVQAASAYVDTKLTIVGNESGATVSVTVRVYRDTVTQQQAALAD